jgi:hypothetical protein
LTVTPSLTRSVISKDVPIVEAVVPGSKLWQDEDLIRIKRVSDPCYIQLTG